VTADAMKIYQHYSTALDTSARGYVVGALPSTAPYTRRHPHTA